MSFFFLLLLGFVFFFIFIVYMFLMYIEIPVQLDGQIMYTCKMFYSTEHSVDSTMNVLAKCTITCNILYITCIYLSSGCSLK